MAMVLSALAVNKTETSMLLHSTFLTPALWCGEVWTQASLEMSHIFTVVSIEPEASTERLEWLREREVTESL